MKGATDTHYFKATAMYDTNVDELFEQAYCAEHALVLSKFKWLPNFVKFH